jgi:hypothetical protein
MPKGQTHTTEQSSKRCAWSTKAFVLATFAASWESSKRTFYRWREKYAGMEAGEAKRLRELEDQNARLKKLLAEQVLHNEALKDVLSKKW